MTNNRRFVLAITGASGAPYARAVARGILDAEAGLTLLVSESGWRILQHEDGLEKERPVAVEAQAEVLRTDWLGLPADDTRVLTYDIADMAAPPASGTWPHDGMAIVPASGGTIAAAALGLCRNLIHRAADVALKERRRLVVCPREMPLGEVHLENMLRLARMGAVIAPAMPGFYTHPASVGEMVAFVAGRILDHLGVEHDYYDRWDGLPTDSGGSGIPVELPDGPEL